MMLIQKCYCAAKTTRPHAAASKDARAAWHACRRLRMHGLACSVSSSQPCIPALHTTSLHFSLASRSHHCNTHFSHAHNATVPRPPAHPTGNVAFEDLVTVAPSQEEEQTSPRRKKKKKKREGQAVELLHRWQQQQQQQQQGHKQQHPQHELEEEEEGGAGLALLCDPRQSGAGREPSRWSNDDHHACSISIYNYGAAGTATTPATTTTVCPRPIRPIMLSNANDARTPLLVVLPSSASSSSSPPTPSSSSSSALAIRPPPLRPLRGLAFATNVLNNISLGCTAPFLQHHLEVHYQQSYQSSGLVFAVFPLVALLCSPLGAVLCRAGRDKFLVWQLGLLTSVLASLGFGLADSVPLFLLMRGLQGLGFALSTIAGLGLLIECSPDLTADIARQEVLVGLSMVAAPAVGGLLYTYAGFAAIFNILAAGFMLLVLGLTAGRKLGYLGGREGGREGEEEEDAWWRVSSWPGSVSTWCCCAAAAEEEGRRSGGEEGSEEEAATALLIPQETTEVIKTQGLASPTSPSPPPLTLLGMLLLPGVLAAALLVMVTFHSISFLELAFAGHAEAALGLAPLGTGLLFSCVDIAYATCAYLMARARKGGKGGREGGREEEKEEEDRLSAVRRREGGHEEEGQRTLSRSSSTSSSSSSSSTSSSRFGLSFLNLRALALTGLACQALAMCFLGPLPLFSLPLPSFLPPSLLAWVSVAIGCLMVGMGEALALVPAVDLMRAGLPPSLPLAMSDGSNSGEGATGHLAAVMSAATSLGECVGPLLGGLLMEVLPQRREVGCKGKGEGGEEGGCVSGFRWTTAWIAMALAIAGCVCYVGLAKEGVGEEEGMDGDEVVAPTPVAAAVAAAATPAAVVEEGGAGMGGGRVHVYKPPTVVIPSPPLPPRRLSRPPTPISLASLRVPSTTSMAKPVSSSSAASSVGGSRRRSSGGGGDRQGEKEPGRKEKSGDREKE